MNGSQELWWKQAKSDYAVFELLRGAGVRPCHPLHYLQMATEKLAKASFWSSGSPPAPVHTGFASMLRRMGSLSSHNRDRVVELFEFAHYGSFQAWLRSSIPLARDIEQLSPSVVLDSVNCEYPWPHAEPENCPTEYEFQVWADLKASKGRHFMRFVEIAIGNSPQIATF